MDWRGIVEHFFFLLWMRTHWRSLCKGLTCSHFVLAKNPRAPVWGSQSIRKPVRRPVQKSRGAGGGGAGQGCSR